MQPTVSVIMPTFNRGYIVGKAIDSVLAQTYPLFELVIMDDGSTDDTSAVISRYRDPRIKYHRYQPNAGPCVARNRAIECSSGTWVCYLDSDNELLPSYIETMLDHFARDPQALFGIPKGDYAHELYLDGKLVASIDKSGMFPAELTIQDAFHYTIPFDMNGFMHARRLFEEGARFDETITGLEDWDLILQMGTRYPDGFLYVPHTLYKYRQRNGIAGRAASGSYASRARKFEDIYRKHRHAPLMRGQAWHPAQADHWNELERGHRDGLIPPLHLYEFPEFWPRALQRVE